MLPKTILLAILAALAVAAPVEDASTTADDVDAAAAKSGCGAPLIIGAKGSNDGGQCGGGPGNLPTITDVVKQRVKNAKVEFVNYPAALDGSVCGDSYVSSRRKGIQDMRSKIHSHVQKCGKKARIALLGYSQGAQVVTDLLSGGSDTGEPALADNLRKSLKAVVLIADPSQSKGSYKVGVKNAQGIYGPIPNPGKVSSLGKKVVSYCKTGDTVCAKNTPPGDVHQYEVDIWKNNAISFISSRIKK